MKQGMCSKIISHKKLLDSMLRRDAGIEIAALDYMRNIENIKRDFSIIERTG